MTLLRTAFRIAIVEALAPTAAVESGTGFSTIAEDRVYDSRFTPADDLALDGFKPVVTVYTGLDDADPAQAGGGPPFKRNIHIEIEIAVVGQIEDESKTEFEVGYPETDAELEATLDLLEAQIRFSLFKGPQGLLFRRLGGGRVLDLQSDVDRSSEERARLALRVIRIRLLADDDCEQIAPAEALTGPARLPDKIKALYDALALTSYGRNLLAGLAPAAPTGAVRTPLETVALAIDVANPDGVVDGTADINAPVAIDQTPEP